VPASASLRWERWGGRGDRAREDRVGTQRGEIGQLLRELPVRDVVCIGLSCGVVQGSVQCGYKWRPEGGQ
jgi:hypothetical protein